MTSTVRHAVLGCSLIALACLALPLADTTAAPAAQCRVRVQGSGVGTGILGAGTQNARAAAIADWERNAAKRFGKRFAQFEKSREPREDCRSATTEAKCVITARPCR